MALQQRKPLARCNGLRARKLPRKRKVGVLAQIEDRLTKLVALVAKWRDGWTCQVGGEYLFFTEAHAHHVENKSRGKVLRWVLFNLLTMCPKHHDWAHRHPADFKAWFAARFPDRWEYIQRHKNEIRKIREDELLEMERVNQDELFRLSGDVWKI